MSPASPLSSRRPAVGASSAIRRSTVTAMTHDSRRVGPGSLYACVRGARNDGHDFAPEAVAAGAAALLVDRQLDVAVPQLVVDDVRLAMGPVAAAVNGHPSRAMTLVGITGTNGKTTTSHLLASIMRTAGMPTAVIGTLSGAHTTPEAPDLQRAARRRTAGGHGRRRDGGLVARHGDAPGGRHVVRRCRVHQPRHRPPRSARHHRGVLPRQGRAVHAGDGGRRRDQRRRRPWTPPARCGEHRHGAVLGRRHSPTSRSPSTATATHGATGASPSASGATSTSPTRSPRPRRPTCSASGSTRSSPDSPQPVLFPVASSASTGGLIEPR